MKLNPTQIQSIYSHWHSIYPNMDFKVLKRGSIFIRNDLDTLERMKTNKSPYNEVWFYARQLEMREKRINKWIKTHYST